MVKGKDGVAGLSQAFIQRVNVKKPLLIFNAGAMQNWVMLTFLWLLKFLLVCLVTSLGNFFKGGSLKWLRG